MRGAYSEMYLDDAMRNMGEMIEYGEEACAKTPQAAALASGMVGKSEK